MVWKKLSMNILIRTDPSHSYKKNKIFEIDNGDNIFFGFKKKLEKIGININTIDVDTSEKVDYIIFCDVPLFWELSYIKKLLLNRDKSILLCFEPPVISPLGHRKFFHHFFSLVYTWNDKLVNKKKVRKFHLPVLDSNLNFKEIPFKKKKLLVLLNSNKSVPFPLILLSPYKKVLYLERLKAINFFENKILEEFDLYGRGWNQPMKFSIKEKLFGHKKYLSYRGDIPRELGSKLSVLSRYKFNICFENCIADGYISEKIIDCFKAHTVPIYLGAPNIEKYIPENCFIDFRKFKDYTSLLNFLTNMDEKTYNQYIENGNKLLKTKKFSDTWFEEGFLTVFLEAISFGKTK